MSTFKPGWHMLYTDYNGVRYGEILDAHQRKFNFNLLTPNTISFTPNLSASMTASLLTNKEGLILLYRGSSLAMAAELSSLQIGGDEQNHNYTVVATETMWTRLIKRLLGQSSAGLKGPTNPSDQGQWLVDRLDDLNAINKTGLRGGTVTASGNISGGVWRYKPWMELCQELSATTAGFDFYQRPRDPKVSGVTGAIDFAPVIGRTRRNVVFQYGSQVAAEPTGPGNTPANARDWRWQIDWTNGLTRALVLPPSFPDNAGLQVVSASDAAAETLRGRREEVIPSDLSDPTLRTQLAQLHVKLRKQPREQFIIQPSASDGTRRVPQFLVDYNVGDTIRGRVYDQGLIFLDAMVRVYGVQVNVDDLSKETIDLTLINDGAATAA